MPTAPTHAGTVPISHSQIAVFDAGLSEPFNDWDDARIASGMSGSASSVSFVTPIEAGEAVVTISIGDVGDGLSHEIGIRGGRGVEISGIHGGFVVDVPDGRYRIGYRASILAEDSCQVDVTMTCIQEGME